MAQKKNGKSKTNKTTTLQQTNDAKVSATINLVAKSTETSDNGNQVSLKVVIQQQQVATDELVTRIVKYEERVTVLKAGLASGSHVTSFLQEQLATKTDN